MSLWPRAHAVRDETSGLGGGGWSHGGKFVVFVALLWLGQEQFDDDCS